MLKKTSEIAVLLYTKIKYHETPLNKKENGDRTVHLVENSDHMIHIKNGKPVIYTHKDGAQFVEFISADTKKSNLYVEIISTITERPTKFSKIDNKELV